MGEECKGLGKEKGTDLFFLPSMELSMDHIIPLARGGKSIRGNVVTACRSCNQSKKLETPVETVFWKLAK